MVRFLCLSSVAWVFCSAVVVDAAEILVSKPQALCPKTKFTIPNLQAQYDQAWGTFSSAVEDASAAIERELKTQRDAAQAEGNLDLLKFWIQQHDRFRQTGQFRWDAGTERRTWDRFGGPAFPHSVATQAQKAADTFARAVSELANHYKQIEVALVRLGDVEQAEKIREEKTYATEVPPTE